MDINLLDQRLIDFYQVEPDMASPCVGYEELYNAEALGNSAWESGAFAGLYELTEDQRQNLLQAGRSIFSKLCVNDKILLSKSEKNILSLSMVEIAKTVVESKRNLWAPILQQLGYDTGQSRQLLENALRTAFRETTKANSRYFCESSRSHNYYNSINAHALAPGWALDELIRILFSFYAKNLEFHYKEADDSFVILANKIAQKREGEKNSSELKLPSGTLSSSFELLFCERPHFMAALCDSIVGKIDSLLKGDESVLCEHSRLDQFISHWLQKQTAHERKLLAEKRKNASIQRVVTRKENITPQYHLQDESFLLGLPRIRLPEITQRPEVYLYQGSQLLHKHTLSIFGDELCWTTREYQFSLTELKQMDWSLDLNLQIKILCGQTEIYNSQSSLFRPFLVFDRFGDEISKPRNGTIYLLTSSRQKVQMIPDSDDIDLLNHPGNLYSVPVTAGRQILVNGCDIFQKAGEKPRPSIFLSRLEQEQITVTKADTHYDVFNGPITAFIFIPLQDQSKNYQVFVDSARHQLPEYANTDSRFEIPLPRTPRYCHTFRIRNFETGQMVYELNYMILTDFSCQFDPPFYFNTGCDGCVKIRIGGKTETIPFSLSFDQNEVQVPLWEKDLNALIRVPKLNVSISGQNAWTLEKYTWYEDFDKSSFLSIQAPDALDVTPVLSGVSIFCIPKTQQKHVYDLGNFLASKNWSSSPSLTLGILIRNGGTDLSQEGLTQEKLTQIIFQPELIESPLVVKNKRILWQPEGKYHGPNKSEFLVKLYHRQEGVDPFVYRCGLKQLVLEKHFPFPDGFYQHEIFLDRSYEIFPQPELCLERGVLPIGEPNRTRWKDKELHLTAVYSFFWSREQDTGQTIKYPLRNSNGIITGLKFEGYSVPTVGAEEDAQMELPQYSGWLNYETHDGTRYLYNFREGRDLEVINPIKIWVTPDQRVILETHVGEPLRITTKHAPDIKANDVRIAYSLKNLSREEEDKYIRDADSFAFIEKSRQ